MLYPLRLQSIFKDYLWGGTRLKTLFNKETPLEKVAESWELACHKDGDNIILNGPYKGTTLKTYVAREQEQHILGSHGDRFPYFPLLIKLIDAKRDLSLQVHPDNEYALEVEGEYGKTELWYVLEAEEGASLVYGVNKELTRSELRQKLERGNILDVVNRVAVKKGDVFFIDAGTLHSIGGGILLAEIQQNSNTTYRLYDYDRIDKGGKKRALHIDKALDVVKLSPSKPTWICSKMTFFAEYDVEFLSDSEFFKVYRFDLHGRCHLVSGKDSFHSIVILEGVLELEYPYGTELMEKGDSFFVPAYLGEYFIRGTGSFLLSMV